MRTVIKQTFSKEGIRGFYKGMAPRLVSIPMASSVTYMSYEFSKTQMGVQSENDFTFKQCLMAGSFAGIANCLLVVPVELVKTRL